MRVRPSVAARAALWILPMLWLPGPIPTAAAQTSQTITFNALGGKIFGAAAFTVSATASSGLPVSFASLTNSVCTVSVATVTVAAAGTCTVQASQPGNATYAAAPNVSQSFVVAKAAQTISFAALVAKTYGAAPFTVTATASSALAVTFISTTTTVCTVAGSTVTIVTGGTCTIQARQAGNGNYNAAANVNQSFAVAKAAQTITFGALTGRTYGNPPFTVSATASSGLAVTFSSSTVAVCTISANTATIVSGGTCTINAAQAGNTSYLAATTVPQSFAVAKAVQTITFGVLANQTYGVAPFAVSASASSGLAVTFTSTTTTVCTVSGGTVTIRTGGICTINAAQSGNASYVAATTVSRSFTVAKANQTITFGALANQTFGVLPFTVSATVSSALATTFSSLTTTICTVSGSTVTIRAGGTCTLQAAQAGNTSYNAAPSISQSFIVAKATQTIAFGTLSDKTFGAAPFTVSATASSSLAVTFSSLTPSVCTVSGSTVTAVAAGVCTIQAAQAGNGNYNPAPNVSQSFSIGPGSQTINFPSPGPQLITASPLSLAASASSGLPVSFSSLTAPVCTASGAVATLVKAGVCTIQATQTGNISYAAAPSVSQSFAVLGVPQFVAPVSYAAGTYPGSIAVADFNGDGKTDLAIANAFSATLTILLGRGDGTFAPGASVQTGGEPLAVAAGDLNGDGKVDLAVADFVDNVVLIYIGNGNGTFTPGASINAGPAPADIAIADLNGDGKRDLVVVNGTRGSTIGQTVTVLSGNGNGSFGAALTYATGASPYQVTVADFNGDGKPDLAIASGDTNAVWIHLGHGDGTFTLGGSYSVGSYPDAVAAADFNSDGKLDLAVGNDFSNDVSILLGRGDGTFGAAIEFPAGAGPAMVSVADFNGDGLPDLAIVNRFDDTVALLLGNGNGTFQTPIAYAVGDQPKAAIAKDLNGDGKPDLVVTSAANSNVSVLLQMGSAPTQAPSFTSATLPAGQIAIPYSYTVAAGGVPQPTFAVTAGGLPPGLMLNGATGAISGAPTSAGTFSGVLTASNGIAPNATQAFAVTIGLTSQSITFGPLSNQPLSSSPLVVAPTASSGLAVSLSSLTPAICVVGGNAVVLQSLGTCTIRAAQAGNATYAVAPNVDRSFAITAGAQTIAFAPISSLMSPLVATASSGLPVSFISLTPTVCAVNGDITTWIRAGTCTIRAGQAGNASYSAAPNVDQSFTQASSLASQTIAFPPIADRMTTASPFTLSATASSRLAVSFTSLTPTVCSVSGNVVTLTSVGVCAIQASQTGNATYSAAYFARQFNVGPTPLAVPLPPVKGPFLEYATYLGGYGIDKAFDVVVTPDGSAYVGGSIASTNFPGLSSAAVTNAGLDLLFVTKINPNGGVVDFSAVVGGRAADITGTGGISYVGLSPSNEAYADRVFLGGGQVEAMASDAAGNVYVAAYANSTDFPLRGPTYARTGPKYIYKISATGTVQAVSASIDPAVMTIRAITIDAAGAIYFTGVASPGLATTAGALYPAMPAPTGSYATASAPYVIKLAPGGATTSFSTYVSVSRSRPGTPALSDESLFDAATTPYAISVDAAGYSYLAGQATSDEFPRTTGSPDTADSQHRDAFVAKINPTGTALAFVARLGGGDGERATSLALGPDGTIVIGGKTATQPFVGTTTAFQDVVVFRPHTPYVERETGFIAKLSADGSRWVFVAALGTDGGTLVLGNEGVGDALPVKVAVDASGSIYAAGTGSLYRDLIQLDIFGYIVLGNQEFELEDTLPAANDLVGTLANGAFVVKVSPDGQRLIHFAALGGGNASGLALDRFGNAYVTGWTSYGVGLPVVNAGLAAPMFGGSQPTPFIAKLNDRVMPLDFTSGRNPSQSDQVVVLRAVVADARYTGNVEFDDGAQTLASVPVVAGVATAAVSLPAGIHRLKAVFHGSGPFNNQASPEIMQIVNQAPADDDS
jgi:hypothetical protein